MKAILKQLNFAQAPQTAEGRSRAGGRQTLGVELRTSRITAFTLVELLAVISIILVLIGLALAGSKYLEQRAMVSRTRAEIKAIELALEAYKADNGGYPPLNPLAFNQNPASAEGFVSNDFPNGNRINVYAGTYRIKRDYILWGPDTNQNPDLSYCYVIATNGWNNSQFIYRALTQGPKKYMTFNASQTQVVYHLSSILPGALLVKTATVIIDPWGFPLGYNPVAPKANPATFDLWSAGPDNLCSNAFYYSAAPGSWGTPVPSDDDISNWR